MRFACLVVLVCSLVEVHSQTFPYVSFMGQTLANHSYVDLSLVGDDSSGSNTVQCHTNLGTCCSNLQGSHRGDWYFPNGIKLPFTGDIHERRDNQRVHLRRENSATPPVGIYCCDIATLDDTSVRATVYVGLYYASGGGISISGNVTYETDQLTLTCISTGGPATTVTWTRDNVNITGEQNETVLNNAVNAQYTHTLTVTTAGVYTCTVSNNKPSSATSTSTTVPGASPPTDVTAVQDGPTSIRVTWTLPSPLGDTTGYRISFTGGGNRDSVNVSRENSMSHTLTGLTNGVTYTISVITISSTSLPSAPVHATVGLVPQAPVLNTTPTVTATTITITGSVPSPSVVTGFVVHWQRDMGVGCSNKDQATIIVSGGLTSYVITELEEGNRYSITVNASNAAGNGSASNAVAATTEGRAPTGAPASVTETTVTSTSVTVQWEEVPCLDRNGEITDYQVVTANSQGMTVGTANNDVAARQATISGLTPSTQYAISVAAVNSAGIGPIRTILIETTVPAPGQVLVSVSSITATSISLSWSVASGRVASWEVVWRPTDRGTESTSGSLPGNTYTIHHLDSSTNYTITVRATNVAGTTDSTPILFSTATDANQVQSTSCENTSAIIGGVVAVVFMVITSLTVIVIVVLVLRSRSRNYSTSTTKPRGAVGVTNQSLELSKFSEATEATYVDPDQFQTTSNMAYNVVKGTGRTVEAVYEMPQDLPPSTSSSSQPTTTAPAGDYETV